MILFLRRSLQSSFFFLVALFTFYGLPVAVAQEEEEQPNASQEKIAKYEEINEQAKEKRIDAAVQENKTGTDPRDFSLMFLWNAEALGFTYGKDGKMSGSILLGTSGAGFTCNL